MIDRTWLITPLLMLASLASRLTFQHSIETRFQIVAFWLAAGGYEAVCYSRDVPVSFKRLIINALVTAICITLVRWRLEGLPFNRL